MKPDLIDGFEPPRPVRLGSIERQLYVSSTGTVPLVVLHELPGMSPSFISYCVSMVGKGYKIYMPLLFMTPNTQLETLQSMAHLCVTKEFRELFCAEGEDKHARPFTAWMLHLIAEVREQHPEEKIGVIGMCLTGGFALAAIADPGVHASVACQPSMPFFHHFSTLALSASERDMALKRARSLPKPCAKGYRYAADCISGERHMKAAEELFGDAFERHLDLAGQGHSTLTQGQGNEPNKEVIEDVLAFLDKRLK